MVQLAALEEEILHLKQAEETARRAVASIVKGIAELEEQQAAHERTLTFYDEELKNMKSALVVKMMVYRDVKDMRKDAAALIRHIDNQILERFGLKHSKLKELEAVRASIKAQENKLTQYGRLYEFPTYDQ